MRTRWSCSASCTGPPTDFLLGPGHPPPSPRDGHPHLVIRGRLIASSPCFRLPRWTPGQEGSQDGRAIRRAAPVTSRFASRRGGDDLLGRALSRAARRQRSPGAHLAAPLGAKISSSRPTRSDGSTAMERIPVTRLAVGDRPNRRRPGEDRRRFIVPWPRPRSTPRWGPARSEPVPSRPGRSPVGRSRRRHLVVTATRVGADPPPRSRPPRQEFVAALGLHALSTGRADRVSATFVRPTWRPLPGEPHRWLGPAMPVIILTSSPRRRLPSSLAGFIPVCDRVPGRGTVVRMRSSALAPSATPGFLRHRRARQDRDRDDRPRLRHPRAPQLLARDADRVHPHLTRRRASARSSGRQTIQSPTTGSHPGHRLLRQPPRRGAVRAFASITVCRAGSSTRPSSASIAIPCGPRAPPSGWGPRAGTDRPAFLWKWDVIAPSKWVGAWFFVALGLVGWQP